MAYGAVAASAPQFFNEKLRTSPDRRYSRNAPLPVCCRSLPYEESIVGLLNAVASGSRPAYLPVGSPFNITPGAGPTRDEASSGVPLNTTAVGRQTMPMCNRPAVSEFETACDVPSVPLLAEYPHSFRSFMAVYSYPRSQPKGLDS